MALPRALPLALLLAAAAVPAVHGDAPLFFREAGWYVPGDRAAALAQFAAQGLGGDLVAQGGTVQGAHVAATWDPRGLGNWSVDGATLLERVDLDLQGHACTPTCYSTMTGPVAALGHPGQGVFLVDAARAALVAAAPEGVAARLPEGATRLAGSADGQRAVWAVAGLAMLLAGDGMAADGRDVRAPALLALRLAPAEVAAALALPPDLAAWLSPGAAPSTAWLSPLPRADDAPGVAPEARFAAAGQGLRAARFEVGRLADPDLGPVVLGPGGAPVPEVPAEGLAEAARSGPAVNVTRAHPPVVWVAHDAAQPLALSFRLDTVPPRLVAWEVLNATHAGVLLRATADEHVLGRIAYKARGDPGPPVVAVTGQPALRLDFPLLALRADTTYEAQLTLTDFAGNTAVEERTFATLPRPDVPNPAVLSKDPAPGARPAAPVRAIAVAFDPAGPFDAAQHVRLFVDKSEVPLAQLAIAGGTLRHEPPQPLGPGLHTVGLVLRNGLGGRTEQEWSFTAEGATPGPAAVLGLAALALAARRHHP